MLKSLLLIVDKQTAEHGSVDLGIRWSVEFNAILVGLGVIDEAEVRPLEAVPIGGQQSKHELDAARMRARQIALGGALSSIAVRCARARAAFKPLECMGSPAEHIGIEAQRFDLILMPRALTEAGEWEISDTLQTVLRGGPRPVVAVPDQLPSGTAVAIAYDGSLQAARTVYAFAASGLASLQPVHVFAVHDDPVEAAVRGNRAVEFLASRGVRASLVAEAASNPAMQIIDFAGKVDAGLIVLGAYGKSRMHEFFLGSVTQSILSKCPTPLFLFH